MRAIFVVITIFIVLLVSCKKDIEEEIEQQAIINNEEFNPNEFAAKKKGNGYEIIIRENIKKVTIQTNSTEDGTYIITESFSGTDLQATLKYENDSTEFKGVSGDIQITSDENGNVSGVCNAKVQNTKGDEFDIAAVSFEKLETGKPIVEGITANEVDSLLKITYGKWQSFIEFSYLFDAVYTHVALIPNTSWQYITTREQTAEDVVVKQLWDDAWEIVGETQSIIETVNEAIGDISELEKIEAQANTIRCHIFYTLHTWFDKIPLYAPSVGEDQNVTVYTGSEIQSFLTNQLISASAKLPDAWPQDDKFRINKAFALGVLLRMHLYMKDYDKAKLVAEPIKQLGYSLNEVSNVFSVDDNETFTGFERNSESDYGPYYTKSTYIPVMRYTETLLAFAEATFNTQNIEDALKDVNTVRKRSELDELESEDFIEFNILQMWILELKFEGGMFCAHKRFNNAVDHFNLQNFQLLLPIPQHALNNNSNLQQNPGY
ncbi:MAG: RagB/SusD family nutrient uptake outer membrane protein [Bacteroidales bacterium]|nr:RagB/SusD family nutrient uptake outer membrane protein [Bacteroidales bacterium]